MGAFTHPVFPACGGSSGGELSVNIRRRAHHHLVCITEKAGTRTDVERESLRQKPQVPATRHGFCRTPQRQKPDGKNRSCERGLMVSEGLPFVVLPPTVMTLGTGLTLRLL
ncbi:hypothetical protein GWK47_051159 [Chionoecetes opilio]|uniref:Uncharacterized protein n=1 Tax=Chionoecetes opilio TaxID=41210 RepID=A0A8J4Y8D7_CHIOP|nr:hypothetical protein GWK47_051159 [Chionoecetes opilio]